MGWFALNDTSPQKQVLNRTESDDFFESGRKKPLTLAELSREGKAQEYKLQYAQALEALHAGNLQTALTGLEALFRHDLIREIVAASDESSPLHQLAFSINKSYAFALLRSGERDRALELFIEALKLQSDDASIWCEVGRILLRRRDYANASLCFRSGLGCCAEVAVARWQCLKLLCETYLVMGNFESCFAGMKQALRVDPLFVEGQRFVGEVTRNDLSSLSLRDKFAILAETPIQNEALLQQILSDVPIVNLDAYRSQVVGSLEFSFVPSMTGEAAEPIHLSISNADLFSAVQTLLDFLEKHSSSLEMLTKPLTCEFTSTNSSRSTPEIESKLIEDASAENSADEEQNLRISNRIKSFPTKVTEQRSSKHRLLMPNLASENIIEDLKELFPADAELFDSLSFAGMESDDSDDFPKKMERYLSWIRRPLFSFSQTLIEGYRSHIRRRKKRSTLEKSHEPTLKLLCDRWRQLLSKDDQQPPTVELDQHIVKCFGAESDVVRKLSDLLQWLLALGKPQPSLVEMIRVLCIEGLAGIPLSLDALCEQASLKRELKFSVFLSLEEMMLKTLRELSADFKFASNLEFCQQIQSLSDLILCECREVMECNRGLISDNGKIKYWWSCASMEKAINGPTSEMTVALRECMTLLQRNATAVVENSIGDCISLQAVEDELHEIRADLFLAKIEDVFTRGVSIGSDQKIVESIVLADTLDPSATVDEDLPLRVLKKSFDAWPVERKLDLCGRISEAYLRLRLFDKHVASLVKTLNYAIMGLFSFDRFHFLFVEHWSESIDDSDNAFDRFQVSRRSLQLLLRICGLIFSLSEAFGKHGFPQNGLVSLRNDFLLALIIVWDLGKRFQELAPTIQLAKAEISSKVNSADSEMSEFFVDFELLESLLRSSFDPWIGFLHLLELSSPHVSKVDLLHYLSYCHDNLGDYGVCGERQALLLNLIVDRASLELTRSLEVSDSEQIRLSLFQAFNCLYGFRVTTESMNDLVQHSCYQKNHLPLTMNLSQLERVYRILKPYLFQHFDRKDVQDTIKTLDSLLATYFDESVFPRVSLNKNNITSYVNRWIVPSQSLRFDSAEWHLEVVDPFLKAEASSPLPECLNSILHLKGQILFQAALKVPVAAEAVRKQARRDMFADAIVAFGQDLTFNPSRLESWYNLAICHLAILDDLMLFGHSHYSAEEYETVFEHQRKAFWSLIRFLQLAHRSKDADATVSTIAAYSELGHLVYLMVSKPSCGGVSFASSFRDERLRDIVSQSVVAEGESTAACFISNKNFVVLGKRKAMQEDEENNENSTQRTLLPTLEFPEEFSAVKSHIAQGDEKFFYCFAATCFLKCRKLLSAANSRRTFDKRTKESWEWTHMMGKCSEKVGRDSSIILKYYKLSMNFLSDDWNKEFQVDSTRSRSPASDASDFSSLSFKVSPTILSMFSTWRSSFSQTSTGKPIDPIYKYLSFVLKQVAKGTFSAFDATKALTALPFDFASISISDFEGSSDAHQLLLRDILKIAVVLKKYDKWFHRLTYRMAWFFMEFHDGKFFQEIATPRLLQLALERGKDILTLFQLKGKFTNFWRGNVERVGRYVVSTFQYVQLLLRVLIASGDADSLLLLVRKKPKMLEQLWLEDLWKQAAVEYGKSFEEQVSQLIGHAHDAPNIWWKATGKVSKKVVARSVPILEVALCKRLESNSFVEEQRPAVGFERHVPLQDILELMKRIAEMRKIINTTEILDKLLSSLYCYVLLVKCLFESWIAQRFEESKNPKLPDASAENEDTVVEIDRNLTALIAWALESFLASSDRSVRPSLVDIKLLLVPMMKSALPVKPDVETVDDQFFVLKALSLLKNQRLSPKKTDPVLVSAVEEGTAPEAVVSVD